jgi:hypothetical protein
MYLRNTTTDQPRIRVLNPAAVRFQICEVQVHDKLRKRDELIQPSSIGRQVFIISYF